MKSEQQVCWLQPGHLAVHQSFQPPAEIFLVGMCLEGSPCYLLGPEDRFFGGGSHFGPMSNGELSGQHPQCPIQVEGIDTKGCCLVPRGDR
jgi:hypothetical protein